ncbi:MAG: CpsD/CapB family tyrosine-protein kinase, partial [Acidobacteria bacterium]|nr:CpsD/CapB family tyrosine-protein kinase [Acidobacteriota bacterium]
LRRGRAASYLQIEKSPGMADVLRGKASIEEATRQTPYPNLWVIPAGRAPDEEVGELLGKPEVDEIVGRLRRDYDYVLIDTPPITRASDAGILGRAAHEALLVVHMYKTHRESVDTAIRLLHAANVKPVGVVLTHQQYVIPSYLYRYS